MITTEVAAEGSCLRVACAGSWEYGSRGTQCGYLLRATIQRSMIEAIEYAERLAVSAMRA